MSFLVMEGGHCNPCGKLGEHCKNDGSEGGKCSFSKQLLLSYSEIDIYCQPIIIRYLLIEQETFKWRCSLHSDII